MLSQEARQEQRLSQYQIQSLHMLSLNGAALDEMLAGEEWDNPILEPDQTAPPQFTSLSHPEDDAGRPIERIAAPEGEDLAAYLKNQLPYRRLSGQEVAVFERMLDFLEPRTGFLPESIEELSALLGAPLDVIERCLALLHGMEPAGVGAANVSESLVLQAHRRGWSDPKLYAILFGHLEDVAAGRYRAIMRAEGLTMREVEAYAARIRSLEPYPAAGFGGETTAYIVPDLRFAPDEDGVWQVQALDRWGGGVPYSTQYAGAEQDGDEALRSYLHERRQHAELILQCVQQRRATLLKLGECVLERQLGFLMRGEPLCTLTREELAAQTGLHLSTVSRAFKDKYVQTPARVYPFSFFLSKSSGRGAEGAEASRSQALAALSKLLKSEDPGAPLSDSALVERLAEAGVTLSRRTVAKYRALLGVPGAYERRK